MDVTGVREMTFDGLRVAVFASNEALGVAAAEEAAAIIEEAIANRGVANIVVATGNSQLTFLRSLRERPGIRWEAVTVFHMDEYLGLTPGHPASFPLFLREHLIDRVRPAAFFPVPGNPDDVGLACSGYGDLLRAHRLDLCVLGIGENGHLAFNDPPVADFDDRQWVRVVELDPRSRNQQVGEGHFASLEDVPRRAITLTIPALRAAAHLLCLAPEARKAEAVRRSLLGPIDAACPASILRRTPHARLFLDPDSASRLSSGGAVGEAG
jgi:glucosamine-6-phosphate deaminase